MARPRKKVPQEMWWQALADIFKACQVEADPVQQKKLFFQIFATLAKYLYSHADCKFSLGYMDIEKTDWSYKKLFQVVLNKPQEVGDAEEFEKYITRGGVELEARQEGLEAFCEFLEGYADEIDVGLRTAEKKLGKQSKKYLT